MTLCPVRDAGEAAQGTGVAGDEDVWAANAHARSAPDLNLNLSGIFWTEVAKINSRTKQTGSEHGLSWDSRFPSHGKPVKCRRPSTGFPNWNGPYKEIMTAIASASDSEGAKRMVLEVIRSEKAHVRTCIEQMHSMNAALQCISLSPTNGHSQLVQLGSINQWLRRERDQARRAIQQLKLHAEPQASGVTTHDDHVRRSVLFRNASRVSGVKDSDAGAPESRVNFATPNIIRYDVIKINRVNRNSRRVLEIDVHQHCLAIVRPEWECCV